MNSSAQYQVARGGKVIGNFSIDALSSRMKVGGILPTDHFWTEGMGDWQLVETLRPAIDVFRQQQIKKQSEDKAAAEQIAAEKLQQASESAEQAEAAGVAEVATPLSQTGKPRAIKDKWSCTSCDGSFERHAVPENGKAGIKDALKLFGFAMLSLFALFILYVLQAKAFRPSRFEDDGYGAFLFAVITFVLSLGFLVLLAWSAFEFICSYITRGIFRSGTQRMCPLCRSPYIKET